MFTKLKLFLLTLLSFLFIQLNAQDYYPQLKELKWEGFTTTEINQILEAQSTNWIVPYAQAAALIEQTGKTNSKIYSDYTTYINILSEKFPTVDPAIPLSLISKFKSPTSNEIARALFNSAKFHEQEATTKTFASAWTKIWLAKKFQGVLKEVYSNDYFAIVSFSSNITMPDQNSFNQMIHQLWLYWNYLNKTQKTTILNQVKNLNPNVFNKFLHGDTFKVTYQILKDNNPKPQLRWSGNYTVNMTGIQLDQNSINLYLKNENVYINQVIREETRTMKVISIKKLFSGWYEPYLRFKELEKR